jgi:methylenetetrahydrofolate dehydrogenase (NADP+)/methenyltetrahydrofolate cyclohydrolase
MEELRGLPVANAINEKLIEQIKDMDVLPQLAIIRVGERPDDCAYERGAVKKMEKVGVRCKTYTFAADIDNETFQKEFDKINTDADIDGILVLRPLPKQLDERAVEIKIDPRKDKDIAAIATPVPGGVGSVTTSVLAKHLVRTANLRG